MNDLLPTLLEWAEGARGSLEARGDRVALVELLRVVHSLRRHGPDAVEEGHPVVLEGGAHDAMGSAPRRR